MEDHKKLPGGVLNGLHPVGKAFLDLSLAIEKLPASTDQTEAQIIRDKCADIVKEHQEKYEKALDDREKLLAICEQIWSEWKNSANAKCKEAEGYRTLRKLKKTIKEVGGKV